ncbi:MAG TPA: SH3 domain-containing protein, partial [Abditibacterium sp.]
MISLFPSVSRRNRGLLSFSLSLAPFVCAAPVAAAPARTQAFKPVGVEAWTSGSQTFIRARPSAAVPPVAKVGRHTPLHVWGKYNGWYRVETHDHIFGWVFNPYLNSPGLEKVREMPRSKARVASNRTAHQTMYGTPAMLKQHFVTYGAKGALVGLQKQGVYLAAASKSRPKTVLAASKSSKNGGSVTRLAAAPRRIEAAAVSTKTVPTKMASPVPVVESSRRAAPATNRESAPRIVPTESKPAPATIPAPVASSGAPRDV